MSIVFYYFYVFEGAPMMVCNALLVAVVFTRRGLRREKEFLVLAITFSFDIFFGLAYLSAGTWRLIIYYTEQFIPAYSSWQCLQAPHVIIFILITPTAGFLTLAIAVDRLVCVTMPLKYGSFRLAYASYVAFAVYVPVIPLFVLCGITTKLYRGDEPKVTKICVQEETLTEQMYSALRGIRITCTFIAVVLYLPFIRTHHALSKLNTRQRSKLARMTVTLALITLNQLVCFAVPDLILILRPGTGQTVFYFMNLNKGTLNLMVLLLVQKEFRRSIFNKKSDKWAKTAQKSHFQRSNTRQS